MDLQPGVLIKQYWKDHKHEPSNEHQGFEQAGPGFFLIFCSFIYLSNFANDPWFIELLPKDEENYQLNEWEGESIVNR